MPACGVVLLCGCAPSGDDDGPAGHGETTASPGSDGATTQMESTGLVTSAGTTSSDDAATTASSESPGAVCGNGTREGAEQCDDGNADTGDGCDDDCTFTEILDVQVAYFHVCALIEGGRVRCWGRNDTGQLGYANVDWIGDDETPADAGDVLLPWPAAQITSSFRHNCARNTAGAVVCWGANAHGELGYGNTDVIGDDESPSTLGAVNIGAASSHVVASQDTSCSLDMIGAARCWGSGSFGRLGYGNTLDIGDDELPSTIGDVPVGAAITEMCSDAGAHTCAVLDTGEVRCWGFDNYGQLGNGNVENIGDDEAPQSQPALVFDVAAEHVACGLGHSCVLLADGSVRCWGHNNYGQLGLGNVIDVGDAAPATTVEAVALDGPAVAITAGHRHTCVRSADGSLRCWGYNSYGQLGLGNTSNVGDDELPDSVDAVDTGGGILRVDAGGNNTCVVYEDHRLRCWGENTYGQNGYGAAYPLDDGIGDDDGERPIDLPDIQLLAVP